MCARKMPFDARDLKGLMSRITRDPLPTLPADYSQPLKNLFNEIMTRNVNCRPSAHEVLKRKIVQDEVRKLLGEVKPQDPKAQSQEQTAEANDAANDHSAELPGAYGACAGRYAKGDLVEFWSATHQEW